MRYKANAILCLHVRALRFSFAITLLAFTIVNSAGQQNVTSASLSGRLEDDNGAAVVGATVTASRIETNQNFVVATDKEGRYRFSYLVVGDYKLNVQAAGFTTLNRVITITVGQALDMPLRISVPGITEQVEVTNELAVLETVRTQLAETIRLREIDELPLNGRNYLDLALLTPAVSRTNTGSNQRFAETSAVPGQGLSIAGQRNLYNSFIVDGLSANDDAADLTGTVYSQEVIREFQVITSGGIAQFGRASAGVINIITQSGSNDWRGRLYGFLRNQRFDGRNPLAPRKDQLTQAQYGGSIGGPIKHDRTFLFTNFEQTRRNDSVVITIAPSAVASINAKLNQVMYPASRVESGVVPGAQDTTNLFARLDHRLNTSNSMTARYSLYDISAINSRNVGGLNAVSRGTALANRDQTVALSNVYTMSSRSLNETRVQFTRSRLKAPINDIVGPGVNISGVANFGTATFSPLGRDIDLFEIVDDISTQRSTYSLKAGADFLYNRINILFPGALQGVYTFTSLNNFLSGTYGTFQQAFGSPSQSQSNPNIGLFVQHEWRARDDLTFNTGVRYDLQFLPQPIQTDTNNLAPRLGVAYAPGDRKTVIRASFGLYYDRIPMRATSNALQRDGSKYIVVQLSPTQVGAPVFPNVLLTQPASLPTRPNITRIDPNIENSYSEQGSLQVERDLAGNMSISAGYIYLRGLHNILSRNVNVPRFPASAGVPNLGRPDPAWGNISRFESSGDSTYHGIIIAFNQHVKSWAHLRASYTLSKAIDNTGNFFFSTPQDNFDLRSERGLSDNDQRHRLVVSGSIEGPSGSNADSLRRVFKNFQLSYIFTYASKLPFNIVTGNDRNFDTNTNDRPVGVGRNTGDGFDYASLDLRLSRRFQLTERMELQLLGEGFNVLNRSNLAIPNNTFGTGVIPLPSFRQATAAFDPRQFQFGLRLSF